MAATDGKRPTSDWARFLDVAPYFSSAIGCDIEDTNTYYDFAPLVRAVLYFDIFASEVSNGGVTQYFFNHAHYLREFDRVPELVAAHPLLTEAAAFMREAHALWAEARTAVEVARRDANTAAAQGDEEGFLERASELFGNQRDATAAFDDRFFEMNDNLQMRIDHAVLEDPHAYLDMIDPPNFVGRDVETAEIDGRHGRWRLRFMDGFPCGPNLCEDARAHGGVRVLRFTADRAHLEFDRLSSDPQDFVRLWVDFRSGASSERRFRDGRLESVQSERWLCWRHGLSENYSADGAARRTSLSLNGVDMLTQDVGDSGEVRTVMQRDLDGREVWRRYFVGGRLNTESERLPDGRTRYIACLDDVGTDLAPGGSGTLRELIGEIDGRTRWRSGRLVNGFLDGEVVWTDDGEVTSVERFEAGRRRRS